ncbi:hypothetical protein [Sabulicella glaciei]|uniref:Transmembrane protein n=1 Tax=Sabulicella glaciei TaxID=2984948 RepID=A0ABT3NVA2_9PROT|nr:hypothetical protein [Roseococcus sp. MDT2-1-1]MCW8086103.1 hypothetical protein [Roseococcus sp. MDT2-1-1]
MRGFLGALKHAVVLAPLLGFYQYFRDFIPGAGPQGGEAIFLLMLLYALVLLAIAMRSGVRLLRVRRQIGLRRALLGGIGVIGATLLVIVLGFWLVHDISLAPSGLGATEVALRLLLAAALFYGANLWAGAVARVR